MQQNIVDKIVHKVHFNIVDKFVHKVQHNIVDKLVHKVQHDIVYDWQHNIVSAWSIGNVDIQPGPVAKNATPRPPAGNWTRDPGSLDQRSTDWATEAGGLGVAFFATGPGWV